MNFETTYHKHYGPKQIKRTPGFRPMDYPEKALDADNEIWLIPKTFEETVHNKENLEEAEALIKNLQLRRYRTTYQVYFCKDKKVAVGETGATETFEKQLLEYCKKMFDTKTCKIPPPQPNTRRLFSYIRPNDVYIPLTTYQINHGLTAYEILNKQNENY